MFQIRRDHLTAFDTVALANFEERGVAHLRRHLPAETRSFRDDELRARIRQCVERAKKYDLTTEQHIITFVDATYLAGEHFDSDPKCDRARELLNDTSISADSKSTMLLLVLPLPRTVD